ncbi:secretion system protein E [Haloferax mediterranei ATCC 33500]|uniref:Secretion system protein E n=1 Tax=Haloferax mediterranei (strain ATCC 33500 / DSM 1411 / JCM 8866 / NBRC 14739 / NCIMB 2177 / R-4) TaxID=523841 RepID=I3R3S5_HALMT|nr:ATPase, T2SS/T4P/T4SS family [Haloferax mediterranei]AFK18885.1 type II secretion system protein [Haloferax mediterranei ATCC 33500]AHZ21751.1 secretion system protein E [Haloferax mediterranei ATCC 33500]EMA03256.1 type II secretion system protein [Haloferax mediterranei ATCC 33500]MDX5988979.1 ATPase, T2SS/T4P/T4SS family [Haloferax mediterranei ATCC 33500]QCQ75372.1 secretion system protein E [Haloferax mediterranei ATCC 33500]
MATEDADGANRKALAGDTEPPAEGDTAPEQASNARVGAYTWADFLDEYGDDGDVSALYGFDPRARSDAPGQSRWEDDDEREIPTPGRTDWEGVSLDPEAYLDFHPVDVTDFVGKRGAHATDIHEQFEAFCDPETTPVVKDEWLWEHYKREYYYEDDGSRPRDDEGKIVRFDAEDALGFDPDYIENALARGGQRAEELNAVIEERTVDVDPDLDEDAFFSSADGTTTLANRYDLEKAVPMEKKTHFREVERYWVNKPYAFVILFHSVKENETKYYVVEPHLNRIEDDLTEFLTSKLRTAIKYGDDSVVEGGPDNRGRVIEAQTYELLSRYDLYDAPNSSGDSVDNDESDASGLVSRLGLDGLFGGGDDTSTSTTGNQKQRFGGLGSRFGLGSIFGGGSQDSGDDDPLGGIDGIAARPESAVLADDADDLNDYQVRKMQYYLRRDFIGYERIDGIKHDINVEDISCDGYNSPVFVYHSDYEQIISNVYHGEGELDDFVVKLAQRSGKGISKRRPQVDATLPDGSRAQLTLGREVSDHGTNYTIRQFKDVPFTPIDLINWSTFSLEEMAFLWLCIENDKSLIFAGGTASGKTTSLNAVSLFIPSNTKIVSIEDTREVELPQRNWIASVTRPSFADDDKGDVDEFDLLEAALRQRPDYIVMGEIRGEEGRTLFQVMSTGHTTYTTFHADSVGEVLKRFTTAPINVSKTMFTALDLVSIQTSTRVGGNKVRRNKSLTEINHYDPENDEINVQDVYQWQAETDEFLQMGSSNTLEEIKFDRGWNQETLELEIFKRQVILAYLIDRGLNTYTQVAATFQAFINDQDTIIGLMATDDLERSLEDLREMESVHINIDPESEAMVPRPEPPEHVRKLAKKILRRAEEELFPDYRGRDVGEVAEALGHMRNEPDVEADPAQHAELDALEEATTDPELDEGTERSELDEGDETPEIAGDDGPSSLDGEDETPALESGPDDAESGSADDLWNSIQESDVDADDHFDFNESAPSFPDPNDDDVDLDDFFGAFGLGESKAGDTSHSSPAHDESGYDQLTHDEPEYDQSTHDDPTESHTADDETWGGFEAAETDTPTANESNKQRAESGGEGSDEQAAESDGETSPDPVDETAATADGEGTGENADEQPTDSDENADEQPTGSGEDE